MSEFEPEHPLALKDAWSAFMCPECRGLFRVSLGANGRCQCPLCSSNVAVPSPSADEQVEAANPVKVLPLERRRVQRDDPSQAWDQAPTERTTHASQAGMIWASLFLLSAGIVIGGLLVVQNRESKKAVSGQGSPTTDDAVTFRAPEQAFIGVEEGEDGPLIQIEFDELREAHDASVKFLACQSLEEMAPLIREPERVMPLAREHYQREPFQAVAAHSVDEEGSAQVIDRFVSFKVILADYSLRLIAIELTDQGPLIDWESWVGHCEIPWETVIENKTQTEVFVRARASPASYYNFQFRDENQWVCFRLARSLDEPVIFGYVPRDSPIMRQLLSGGGQEDAVRLRIRYPENPVAKNQVLITDYIGSGWVNGL